MRAELRQPEQRDAFQEQGFAILRGFLKEQELTELQDRVSRFLIEAVPQMADEHVFYETKGDVSTLKQLQHLELYDSDFHRHLTTGPLRELAENLMSGDVVPKNLQYFSKPPGKSRPTPAHQDGYYFMLNPCEAVTMWLALDTIDEENGCVRYVRASHRTGLRPHQRSGVLGFSQGLTDFPTQEDRQQEVAISAEPGDLLAHSALTVHYADANHSTRRPRRSLGFIYYSKRAREDTTAHEAYQEALAAELKATGKI